MKGSLKKIAGFGGGYRRISLDYNSGEMLYNQYSI